MKEGRRRVRCVQAESRPFAGANGRPQQDAVRKLCCKVRLKFILCLPDPFKDDVSPALQTLIV